MSNRGYGGAGDASPLFQNGTGHYVHMRGLPFRASEGDVADVSGIWGIVFNLIWEMLGKILMAFSITFEI